MFPFVFYFVVTIFRYVTQHICLLKYILHGYALFEQILYDRTRLVFTNNRFQRRAVNTCMLMCLFGSSLVFRDLVGDSMEPEVEQDCSETEVVKYG
jgi:hypothetical protein